ncbi:Na+/H+ antiporter NhaA [Gryllotalpicola koreensis]|uniref:Na+/H+ antiporter NhaA n=1 Tax=Gryllotalpicola koreensis TaxID=993086 RepID=UPI0031D5EF9F
MTSPDRTVWTRSLAMQLSRFAETEAASSIVLIGAIAAALVWINAAPGSYDDAWGTELGIRLGSLDVELSLREWVTQGLMPLFFLVVGLEARREFDLGTLRERRQLIVPFTAGLAGMVLPILIFLAFNLHSGGAHGWGAAMSTDTALALGLLAAVSRRLPEQVRTFLVTVFIVDDLVALVVIAVVYSSDVRVLPLVAGIVCFALFAGLMRWTRTPGALLLVVGVASWAFVRASGIDPIVVGLAIGLVAPAYTPGREQLEHASGIFRSFREQPTSRLAQLAATTLVGTTSPNERLQTRLHPWTSFVIVPLFALANAGVRIDGSFARAALASPIVIGIVVAYVVGKPVAVIGSTALLARLSGGRLRPPVGWNAVAGSGTIAGVGFTVAVLVATLAFTGPVLGEAKIALLAGSAISTGLTWLVVQGTARLPEQRRVRALLGDAQDGVDLVPPVDAARDHIRGSASAVVTVVEYGDFECPHCGRAEHSVRELVAAEDVRFVWRHLPLSEVHPHAALAAEASEIAGRAGRFWELHDLMLADQGRLAQAELIGSLERLGVAAELAEDELQRHVHRARVEDDIASADLSGASGTPTFFINGQRHYGAYDAASLKEAVRLARDQVRATATGGPRRR